MATGKTGTLTWTGSPSSFSVRVNWEETYDPIKNESVVTITSVQAKSTSWYGFTYYPDGIVKINGTVIATMNAYHGTHNVGIWRQGSWNSIKASGGEIVSGSVTVPHNADGTKSVAITLTGNQYSGCRFLTVDGDGGSNWYVLGDKNADLTAIDRTAPTVSCSTTVDSATGLTLKATASATCNKWEYSLNGGSTWTEYSTASGTTASKTLTGLTSKVYSVKVRARKSSNYVVGTSGTVSTDLVAPEIGLTVSNITANSIYINATTKVNCNLWEYSIDNGTSWTQFSTTNGTSATKTISGLTPNTQYSVKVRARKQSNSVKGTSAVKTIKTLGGTIINSVSLLTIDTAKPVLQMNWTVYNGSYTHKLVIKNGTTAILTIEGLTASEGTINKTYSLDADQRTTILKAMVNTASFTATYELTSYDGTTQIGIVSKYTATIRTLATYSKPTFPGFTFADVNPNTLVLTENDQLMIQLHSNLQVICSAATARNEASIARYEVVVSDRTVSSTTTTVNFGEIHPSGSVTITVSAIDTRGFRATKSATLVVVPYEQISIDYWFIRRVNEVEEYTNFIFDGTYSPVTVEGVDKNFLNAYQYRYRKTGGVWGEWIALNSDGSGGSFEFINNEFGSFDPEYSYEINLSVSDQLTVSEVYLSLPKGIPLIAYRSKMVGINNNQPTSALDVVGDIKQNGEGVLGMVGILDADFDTILVGGMYWYAASTALKNAPSTNSGFLLVLSFGANVIHLFTDGTTLFTRAYNTSTEKWSSWVEK